MGREAPQIARRPAASGSSPTRSWLRALELTAPIDKSPTRTLPVVIEELAQRFGDRPALLSDRESFTFAELAERKGRYSDWAMDQGLAAGEVVALMMENRPEYLAIWLGVTGVGAVAALLNTNLRGPSLAHCITLAKATHLIVSTEFVGQVTQALAAVDDPPRIWVHGGGEAPWPRIESVIDCAPPPRIAPRRRPVTLHDRALLIFTSGTTGLPKAANVSHRRLMAWSFWFAGLMDTQPMDRLYDCLPMYHSVGGVVAPGAVLVNGGSVVLREKFSASEFWSDIARWDCTIFQYIGELCRYLLAAPANALERGHSLRLACGNGLRPDIWRRFEERFEIPRIVEFYAATEGNVSLYNVEGEPGAIGRIPPFLGHRSNVALVKATPGEGSPVRDERGFCLRCPPGEVGEAIGRIEAGGSGGGAFEGYSDPTQNEAKIIADVFESGDRWFRTGDLMRVDERGFFFFVDRIGDTFRWKGENVSTLEVSEVLSACPGVGEAAVYGVTVPGADGRAGMASLVVDPTCDVATLVDYLAARLPAYAVPLFLRLDTQLPITETFKQKKQALAAEGFDPSLVAAPLFFLDRTTQTYVILDAALYAQIQDGRVRL